MLQELSNLVVADNTGAKRAMCFRILGQRKEYAHLGDFIRVAIKEASPTGAVKKGFDKDKCFHFDTIEQLTEAVKAEVKEGDAVWFKGSRGMKLETVVDAL